ncbi:hypothetical protein BWQ96_00053 [Gracilariopsis chorda]|uniref:Uncharacterized protein n=1 Tax=Gracilariopsis chorda TaxID=448386 RepID=A0A2V3J6F3_9FLOR|nr:hypothetical protein BWQ96_00053 [Gracilariopsis chorda]|eukprot:PXF49893.1 hypothetical protein BWQ96_00053 [Gracilariopsis chorda]
MVLIRLKAPFVSVIVTVLSTLAELALLSFLFVLNNLHECKQLQRGRSVQVRQHLRRTRLLSVVCLGAFFALEVVFSFYNDPVNNVQIEIHECITASNSVKDSGDSTQFLRASDILVECRRLDNGTITQFGGNFSSRTQQVECSTEAMYTHPLGDETSEEIVADVPFGCVSGGEEGAACVFVQQRGNLSLISAPFFLDELSILPDTLPHIITELHFTPPSNVSLFATRATNAFLQNIQGPSALRRIIYSGASEDQCAFPVVRGSATTVPLAMIVALAAVWAVALAMFASVFALRRGVFFKLDDPMHWATRSVRAADDPLGDNPVLTGLMQDDKTLVHISTSESSS